MEDRDDLYSEVLTSGPSSGTLILVLSKLKEEGRLINVIEECLKALDVYPKDIHIRRILAETYFEAGLISQAEAELEKVTTQIADLISSYKLQAEIFAKQGRENEALEVLRVYLAHQANDQEALNLLESLLEPTEGAPIGEPPPTSEKREVPKISTATLAEIHFNQGHIQEAIDIYEEVVAKNPENEPSRKRLKELKNMKVADAAIEDKEIDNLRQKKEKLIATLESWLNKILEQSKMLASA